VIAGVLKLIVFSNQKKLGGEWYISAITFLEFAEAFLLMIYNIN